MRTPLLNRSPPVTTCHREWVNVRPIFCAYHTDKMLFSRDKSCSNTITVFRLRPRTAPREANKNIPKHDGDRIPLTLGNSRPKDETARLTHTAGTSTDVNYFMGNEIPERQT